MTPVTTPAIVAQSAVRTLPRWALLLLCVAYVVPGFVARDPWKSADVMAFGYMQALAEGRTTWLAPTLVGMPPETEGLLPYWLGAWALQVFGGWLAPDMAARLPFMALLAITLAATWWSVYYLARSPGAQPVAFAFGGEAEPQAYARTLADAGVLALIACLGLALLSHEITSHLTQMACAALVFFAAAARPYRPWAAAMALPLGLAGLALSGAPFLAVALSAGCAVLSLWGPVGAQAQRRAWALAWGGAALAVALLGWALGLLGWRVQWPGAQWSEWRTMGRLLLWFGWPAWPLALWTLWRWRGHIANRQLHPHVLLPLLFCSVALGATLTTQPADRALLLGLPAMATLAAFALPTLTRGFAALIDWFTLLFFSVSAIAIWVVWLSLHTGIPAKPAANVARLAPGFVAHFSPLALTVALAATLAWCVLVGWRAVRNRTALWKTLVLPASGAALCWLLLMTLWLPLLDYARSYAPQVRGVAHVLGPTPGCVLAQGLSRPQAAALQHHARLVLHAAQPASEPPCPWLIMAGQNRLATPAGWEPVAAVGRPTDRNDTLLVLRRASAAP